MGIQKSAIRQPSAEDNSALQPSPLALSLAVFLFLFSVYLLTYSPRFHSSDGLAMFATAESLARRGEWDADQIRWMDQAQGILGTDGHLYIRKGIGVSLLALPLVWLGLILPIWGAATTSLLFNALVTAATGALLFHYLRALGFDNRVALVAGLTFGLATPVWPYAKTFFSDPLAGLCLVAAALALLRFRQTGHIINAFWAGLALSIAIAARYANVVVIPLFVLLLLVYQITIAKSQTSNPRTLISNLKPWLAFVIPLVAVAIAIAFYNLARYGDPLNTGYLPEESFSAIWWQGIAGQLVSPGRGLFLYAPVLLLALPAVPTFFRRHRPEAALAWAIILVHVLLYGKWFMWHGGYAWGARFMVPTIPFFVIGLAPVIEWGKESRRWRYSFLALAILSTLIQILGFSVHFELFQNRLLETGLPLFAPITFFDPRYSPLIGQFQFLRPDHLDFAWISGGQVDWLLLVILIIGVLFTGWALLMKIGRMEGWKAGLFPIFHPSNLPSFQSSILSLLITVFATIWLLTRAYALAPEDLQDSMAVLNAQTTSIDSVVTGAPDESVTFADGYKGRSDVLGLNDGVPLDANTTAALAEMSENHRYVWWFPTWLPADQSRVERWLMRNGYRVEDRSSDGRRLALYYFPSESLTESPVGDTFGANIVLERVATLPNAQPGSVLPVALHWAAQGSVPADYHVFVHLLDVDGNRVAQSDGQPALWIRPTSDWSPGEHIEDRHALTLPADLSPGDYTLIVGLYLPETGKRLLTGLEEPFAAISTVHIAGETSFGR